MLPAIPKIGKSLTDAQMEALIFEDVPEKYYKEDEEKYKVIETENGARIWMEKAPLDKEGILSMYKVHLSVEKNKRNSTRIGCYFDEDDQQIRLEFGKGFKRPHFKFIFNVLWRLLSSFNCVSGFYGKEHFRIVIDLNKMPKKGKV